MRLTVLSVLGGLLLSAFVSSAQRINFTKSNVPLKSFFKEIEKQTGLTFVYLNEDIERVPNLDVDFKNATLESTLSSSLSNNGLNYVIKNKNIVVNRVMITTSNLQQGRTVIGTVKDTNGKVIANATVSIKGTKVVTRTEGQGRYILTIPKENVSKKITIQFSSLGFKTIEIDHDFVSRELNVKLEGSVNEIEDAVVTGIYTRSKESFTGSSSTFSGKELKMIGNQNILQSLRTLDPSFAIQDNNLMGSDPNTMPDINIRGKTSVIGLSQEFENDPNQPLFILDGYETDLKTINDLNMDRVESITILKDAAATAIYGSKSANGVVVVETKKPEAGSFKISYNLNSTVSFADLSDYNLMNSSEKLLFERLSGHYGPIDEKGILLFEDGKSALYNLRLAESKRGVDTYWMNEPLRIAMTQNHNLYADGGDEKMRYGVGFTYGKIPGVMKGSERNAINGSIRLMYRTGNFSFSNYLNIDQSEGIREPVDFSVFSSANPYFRKFDEYGEVSKVLEIFDGSYDEGTAGQRVKVFNPLYDAQLNYINRSPNFAVRNNFDADWRILPELRVRGRFGFNKNIEKTEQFIGPEHSSFESTESLEKGSYSSSIREGLGYNGDVTAMFGKMFSGKHLVNLVGGIRLDHSSNITNGFSVRGFMDDTNPNPAFSNGYAKGSKPNYKETERRSASYYSNVGYSYNNRFLFDGNFRSDGSSLFGVENQFTSTWAAGLAWNVHNEKFMSYVPFLSFLKVRASIGNPGNQNFDARMTANVYSYLLSNQNPFGLAAKITGWGNQNLDWQKTVDKNFGVDMQMINGRLRFNVDLFDKNTDPLLVYVDVPTSTGTSTVPLNFGSQITKGVTVTTNYQILKNQTTMWSINANARRLTSKYYDFGASLERYNKENRSRSLQRFYDGGSPSELWAVRSAGIDPASGREIFVKKDGTQTFVHDYDDEVMVGDKNPWVEGVLGSSFYYKGFNFAMNFRYKLGGQIFLNSLFSKVENISEGAIRSNQDKRALHDRWQKPGDVVKFKSISLVDDTPMSSRFIADEHVFSAESISAGYDFPAGSLLKYKLSGLTIRAYMNQIFRISTVKEERGINYPFARSFSFSIGARF